MILTTIGCGTAEVRVQVPSAMMTGLSILQGYTTSTKTQFSVLMPRTAVVRYTIRSESATNEIELRDITVARHTHRLSPWAVDHVYASGLNPNRVYYLEVRDITGELLDSREFSALDVQGQKLRVLVTSCMDDSFAREQQAIWDQALARAPDLILLLGDNVYATKNRYMKNKATPEILWARYVETRLRLQLYRVSRLIPTLATWDDNDFGLSDGDRDYEFKFDSAEIFRAFFPQVPDMHRLQSGPGVASLLEIRGQQIFLLDDRSFRSPNDKDDADETHWGRAQERWLFDELGRRQSPALIANGDQIFGGYHEFESYERNHPKSFKQTLARLGRLKRPIVFLTGDRHSSEISKIQLTDPPFSTFEITASPMHAQTFPSPWVKTPNPRQLVGSAGRFSYTVLESAALPTGLQLTVTAYTLGDEILYHRVLWVRQDGHDLKVY